MIDQANAVRLAYMLYELVVGDDQGMKIVTPRDARIGVKLLSYFLTPEILKSIPRAGNEVGADLLRDRSRQERAGFVIRNIGERLVLGAGIRLHILGAAHLAIIITDHLGGKVHELESAAPRT
jgi:hypothetical protein